MATTPLIHLVTAGILIAGPLIVLAVLTTASTTTGSANLQQSGYTSATADTAPSRVKRSADHHHHNNKQKASLYKQAEQLVGNAKKPAKSKSGLKRLLKRLKALLKKLFGRRSKKASKAAGGVEAAVKEVETALASKKAKKDGSGSSTAASGSPPPEKASDKKAEGKSPSGGAEKKDKAAEKKPPSLAEMFEYDPSSEDGLPEGTIPSSIPERARDGYGETRRDYRIDLYILTRMTSRMAPATSGTSSRPTWPWPTSPPIA